MGSMHRLLFLAALALAPQDPVPQERSSWNFRAGSWVRAKSSGVSDGEKWAVETRQTVLELGPRTVKMKIETTENGETAAEELVVDHQPDLDLDLTGLRDDGQETLAVDGRDLACTRQTKTWTEDGETFTVRAWTSPDAPTLFRVVRYEWTDRLGTYTLELAKIREEVEVGSEKVVCYVVTEKDTRDGQRVSRAWYSPQVPGYLVRLEEKYEGDRIDTYELTVLEFHVPKD
jgi:hypothetical protein